MMMTTARLSAHSLPEATAGVAFQGVAGAYSHLAVQEIFPEATALPCPSFEEAFQAVAEGKATYAVIPIENSLGGRVADVHHLLPSAGLHIVGEHFLQIHHCLWGVKGAQIENIKTVRSHEQALAQCRLSLQELGIQAEVTSDTAGAARDLSSQNPDDPKARTTGVLSSKLAGELYGLTLLRNRMEDRMGNVTRFIILSARQILPPLDEATNFLTCLFFDVRSVPAALYKALGGFATNGINIVRLESYIGLKSPDRASFYAEIEGHPDQRQLVQALMEVEYFSNHLKVLGVYPANPWRQRPGA